MQIICSICQDILVDGRPIMAGVNCGHSFHADCILRWQQMRDNCPKCKHTPLTLHRIFLDTAEDTDEPTDATVSQDTEAQRARTAQENFFNNHVVDLSNNNVSNPQRGRRQIPIVNPITGEGVSSNQQHAPVQYSNPNRYTAHESGHLGNHPHHYHQHGHSHVGAGYLPMPQHYNYQQPWMHRNLSFMYQPFHPSMLPPSSNTDHLS